MEPIEAFRLPIDQQLPFNRILRPIREIDLGFLEEPTENTNGLFSKIGQRGSGGDFLEAVLKGFNLE
jgi:hypothetical protein